MVNVSFVDGNGVCGVIHNDLSIEADRPVDEELRIFVRSAGVNYDEESPTLDALAPEFLIDLYIHTPVRKVEPISGRTAGNGDSAAEGHRLRCDE